MPHKRLADYTADRDSHPAPKTVTIGHTIDILYNHWFVNSNHVKTIAAKEG